MSTTQPAPDFTMPANSEAWFQMAMKHSDRIRRLEGDLIEFTTEVETQRKYAANVEAYIASEVAAQTEGGKPKFSNETSRKAEISTRLEASTLYQNSKEALRKAEYERQLVTIELAEAQRMFSLAKYGLRAQGA